MGMGRWAHMPPRYPRERQWQKHPPQMAASVNNYTIHQEPAEKWGGLLWGGVPAGPVNPGSYAGNQRGSAVVLGPDNFAGPVAG